MLLGLKVKKTKDEYVKHMRDGRIIAPSVDGNNQDETECQIINRKAISSWFKIKKRGSD